MTTLRNSIFPGRAERRACGIEACGDGCYRLALATLRGGKVTRLHTEDVAGTNEEVRRRLRELGISHDLRTVLALPRADALLRWTQLPTTQPRQVAQMIRHEAATQAPWPVEETCLGYEVFPSDPGYSRVLLMMARQDAVLDHVTRLREFGLRPSRVEFSTVSLARLLGGDAEARNAILLLARRDGREYLRLSDGAPVFSRGIGAAEAPSEMLQKSLDLDLRKNGRAASHAPLVLASDDADGALATAAISFGLSVLPLEGLRPANLNGAAPLPASDLICVGAALGAVDAVSTGNLLPRRELRRQAFQRLAREAKVLVLGAAWTALALGGAGHQAFEIERAAADRAANETALLQREAGDLVSQYEQLELLAGERARVALPLRLVLELYERTPQDIGIVQMVYDDRGSLILGGEASGYTAVFSYLSALGRSPLLRDVRLVHSSKPRSAGKALIEFKLQATVAAGEERS
jgi:hypothetical protein